MSNRRHAQTPRTHEEGTPKIEKPDGDHPVEPPAWVDQQTRQQQSMSTHTRETRTKMSVGQSGTMRLKRSNQPRHGS